MSVLQDKAQAVAQHLNGEQKVPQTVAFDPMMILSIVQIITSIIGWIKNCKKTPAQALDTIKKPGIFARWRAKRLARRHLSNYGFQDHDEHVMAALEDARQNLTEQDVTSMYAEVTTYEE